MCRDIYDDMMITRLVSLLLHFFWELLLLRKDDDM